MKKFIAFATAALLGLSACSGGGAAAGTDSPGTNGNSAVSSSTAPVAFTPLDELSGEITVYAFESMMAGSFLDEAARMFMYQHPNVVVNVETFSAMPEIRRMEGAYGEMRIATIADDPQSRRDYINMVNTELMSGRGPDIMAMDILPFHAYARNGQLVNLRELMDADPHFNINDYRVNIFDALTTDAGQFIFPVDYSFQYVNFDTSLLPESAVSGDVFHFEELIELARDAFNNLDESEQVPMFGMLAFPSMFNGLFAQNFNQFVDLNNNTAHFTYGSFEALLNDLISFEQDGFFQPRMAMPEDTGVLMISPDTLEQMMSQRFFYTVLPSIMLSNKFRQDQSEMMVMSGPGGIAFGGSGNESFEIAGLLGSSFTINHGFGINSNSTNQLLAWEFLKFLSTYAMQNIMFSIGFPTHIETFEARTEFSMANEDREVIDAYLEAVNHFTSLLDTFQTTDTIITDIVRTEVGEFFEGSRSAAEVAQNLQSRITLVLNE